MKSKSSSKPRNQKKNSPIFGNKQPQIQMGLKFSGSSLFKKIRYKLSSISTLLDQYMFWRSPLLWFIVFVNAGSTIFATTWLYSNLDKLPDQIALFYYHFDQSNRFLNTQDLTSFIFLNVFIQAVMIIIASKVSQRFKPLSTFLLTCAAITSITFYIALYKALSLVVS
jgi:hypothetical protein